jgi:predicted small metal-binding protein
MSISINPAHGLVVFIRRVMQGLRTTYTTDGHTDLVKDQLVINSNEPKLTKTSYGTRRSTIDRRFSVDVPLPDGTTAKRDVKVSFSSSIPVGCAFAGDLAAPIAELAELVSDASLMEDIVTHGQTDHDITIA